MGQRTKSSELGKIVSRRKLGAYDGAGHWSEEATAIRLDTKSGTFAIEIPEEVADAGDAILNGDQARTPGRGWYVNRGVLFGGTLNDTVEAFRVVMGRFKRWIDDQVAEKVIVVFFQRNIRHIKGFHDVLGKTSFVGYGSHSGDISFAGNPTMHLDFAVMYQIDGELFTKNDSRFSRFGGFKKPYKVMPWSEEKEAFLAQTVSAFEGLICKVESFCDDAEENITRAVAQGATGMLPAPAEEAGTNA